METKFTLLYHPLSYRVHSQFLASEELACHSTEKSRDKFVDLLISHCLFRFSSFAMYLKPIEEFASVLKDLLQNQDDVLCLIFLSGFKEKKALYFKLLPLEPVLFRDMNNHSGNIFHHNWL